MRTRAQSPTPDVKVEDEAEMLATTVGTADGLHIRIKTLYGTKPVYFCPRGQFVDEENRLIYFYWQDLYNRSFRITRLSLTTGRWVEKKSIRQIKNPWSPLSRVFDTTEAPLPQHRDAADAFCVINGQRVILLFGGTGANGAMTSDLFLICLDMSKWWKVDIPDEVSSRVHAKMAFVENRLYIFGGRGHESYCIANYDTESDKWSWVVRDEPYPSHVPPLGFAGEVLPVYGGAQLLLIPGCIDQSLEIVSLAQLFRCLKVLVTASERLQPYSYYSASHVVLFDIARRRFIAYTDVEGEFPARRIYGLNAFVVSSNRLLDGRVAVKEEPEKRFPKDMLNVCTSIVLAVWHEDEDSDEEDNPSEDSLSCSDEIHDVPELYILNLSTTQKSDCRCLDIHEKLESLGITFASCAAITDRPYSPLWFIGISLQTRGIRSLH
ncbi:hypothetical protein H0H87_006777 [Tephrocybe sp. NHM501043]|nr:hypothetical protein H0H87_006777 [Tephrocybe sp. NHM501043]